MSEHLVAKAGGTSNATASAVEQSLMWAEQADIFVVSAPGRLDDGGLEASKVTKLLKASRQQYLTDGVVSSELSDIITARYEAIALGIGRATVSSHWIDAIRPRVEESVRHSADAASMLGERLQAEIYESLGFRLLDPGRSANDLGSDPDRWKGWLSTAFVQGQRYVMPGNTTRLDGRLVTFDDGGSDISGGLAAYGINAGLNLNLTDDGAKSADPNLIAGERLKPISHMLYVEGRELGRNGTGLVHPAAMVPLMIGDIPTEIRSTFDRSAEPTVLDNDYERAMERRGRIIALSLMEDVVIHLIHEPGMAEAVGRLGDFDVSLAAQGIPLIDSQGAGVDGQKYFVESDYSSKALAALRSEMRHGDIESKADIDLITMVGYDLDHRLVDHLAGIVFNAGVDAKRWQTQRQDLSHGRHSLRISVDKDTSKQIFDQLHSYYMES
ncbi:MAG: hypothetical protein ACHQT9_00810 [Candidatus Saccharimonadales bacterium]